MQARHTYKPVRFGPFDARCAIAVCLFLLHMRTWTAVVAVVTMLVFAGLERRGLSFPAALRAFRAWYIGDLRPPVRRSKIAFPVDYEVQVPGKGT